MADIWLWNSIATRKRSPSDGFLENGLTTLRGYLESKGYEIKIIDWQKESFYKKLAPQWLLSLNRAATKLIFWLSKKNKIWVKLFFPIFNFVQDTVSFVRKQRMKRFLDKLVQEFLASGIKIFGVKVWYGEAFIWADYLAARIKQKDPSILVIAGGFHVTLYEDEFLGKSSFDLGVVSEGERPLEIILGIVKENSRQWDKDKVLSQIKEKINSGVLTNLVYRDGEAIKVSAKTPPSMEEKASPKYDQELIKGKLQIHLVLDSLGCPWGKCNFCVHPHFYRQFYPRPVEHIVKEIENMLCQGIGLFKFAGSETPPAFGVKIAQAILDRGLKIKYTMGCRPIRGIGSSQELYEKVAEDFKIMILAGLVGIFMGGETGNDLINEKIMNKGVTRADIIVTGKAYRQAQKLANIKAYLSLALIYPTPLIGGVSLEQVFQDDLDLVGDLAPDSVIISPCMPFIRSRWYRHAEEFGFNISKGFVDEIMKYEYVLYKPPSMWPPLKNIKVASMSFTEWLAECGKLRDAVEKLGLPTDLTDEFFLMATSSGYEGREGLERFKQDTSLDLVSSDYRNLERITELTNKFSKELAESNNLKE